MLSKELIKKYGKLYSEELGINLASKKEKEIFKWFIASILYGKRISQQIARKTANLIINKYCLDTPEKILKAGWNKLVEILDEGGYVRYDFSTASRLLEICKELKAKYNSLENLHKKAFNPKDLEQKLMQFKGIGPITANIFLRELRPFWKKANPRPLKIVKETARKLKIDLLKLNRKTVKFIRLEAALIRYAKHSRSKSFLQKSN